MDGRKPKRPSMAGVRKRARQKGYRGRSDGYRWLRLRHAALAKVLAEHEPAWAEVAAEMAAAGVAGGRGRPLTADAVRRMWARVCRDVVAARKPNRAGPTGWKPAVVAGGGEPSAAVAREAPTPAAAPDNDVDAMIARGLAWANERSGR